MASHASWQDATGLTRCVSTSKILVSKQVPRSQLSSLVPQINSRLTNEIFNNDVRVRVIPSALAEATEDTFADNWADAPLTRAPRTFSPFQKAREINSGKENGHEVAAQSKRVRSPKRQ